MPIFNEVWRCYSHQRSWPKWHICQISLESNQNKSSYRPDTKHSWANTQVHLEKRKKFGKNTYIQIQQNPGLISCFPLSSPNIPSLKALTEKFTHDQPLCTYLMRYDAHIQSPPRSWPKLHIPNKSWNPMKRIQVIIWTSTVDGRTDGQTDRQTDGQKEVFLELLGRS